MKDMSGYKIIIDAGKYKAKPVCWKFKGAFSLLEVQIAMIVLALGLLGLVATLRMHSRQMEVAESWCREDAEYYIVSQSNIWMQQLDMPAELTTDSNSISWEPPVSGETHYQVELESFELNPENRTASAEVKLKKVK